MWNDVFFIYFGDSNGAAKRKYIENIRGLERPKGEAEIPLKNKGDMAENYGDSNGAAEARIPLK